MAKFQDLGAIQGAMHEMLAPGSYSGWVLLGYVDATTLGLKGKGHGGVEEVYPLLDDAEVQYTLIRFTEKKDNNTVTRDVYIAWTGSAVSKIQAAKKHTHFGDVQKVLAPNHAQLTCSTRAAFTDSNIRLKADPSSGSHILD